MSSLDSPPSGVQRWIARRWSQLRVALLIVAALAIGFGVWVLFDHQPGEGIRALISGFVIAGSYVTLGSTVRYVREYDATHEVGAHHRTEGAS